MSPTSLVPLNPTMKLLRDKDDPFHQDAIGVCEGKIACLLRFMHAVRTHPSTFKESLLMYIQNNIRNAMAGHGLCMKPRDYNLKFPGCK